MPEIVMPRLSDSMEEGTIIAWLKQVGEEVALGEELVEIETDKANMAYESDVAGTLTEVLAKEGETLPIGAPIAVVGEASAPAPAGGGEGPATAGDRKGQAPAKDAAGQAPAAAGPVAAGGPPPPAVAGASSGGVTHTAPPTAGTARPKASPLARRIARERGVDLATLRGSGPGGRVVRADVESAAGGGAPAPAPGVAASPAPARAAMGAGGAGTPGAGGGTAKGETTVVELTRAQQVVARRMAESKATAPHFYLEAEVDMSAAVAARGRLKATGAAGEAVPSFNDMVVKACALALREHPTANGSYRDGHLELHSRVNVGVAVATEGSLVVPTVTDADRKGLREIAAETRSLAARVRDGRVTPPELSGGTFTVSNLGMYGVTNFSAVINPPQAAILAVGAILERPVVRDGSLAVAHLMGLTLACDHRILHGAPAALFLARIRALLEEPLALAL